MYPSNVSNKRVTALPNNTFSSSNVSLDHGTKYMPQFGGIVDAGTIRTQLLPHVGETGCAVHLFGDHQKTKADNR